MLVYSLPDCLSFFFPNTLSSSAKGNEAVAVITTSKSRSWSSVSEFYFSGARRVSLGKKGEREREKLAAFRFPYGGFWSKLVRA